MNTLKPQQRLILNKYLPVKKIATGGFGTVYVARDMLVQRMVAIKTIELTELDAQRAEWLSEDMAREAQVEALNALATGKTTISLVDGYAASLSSPGDTPDDPDNLANSLEERYLANIPGLDEARTASALSDANIVTMYDCQIAGNVVYLVMEYIEGPTLTELLEQHDDDITLDVISAVFESVAHALEVAHSHGVLHFDIKPDNVLIDANGVVKVTDFGLATLVDSQGQGTAAAGTIGYMPLEQMRREPLDARTDEWSLASIVYEMLAGKNPFIAPTLAQAERLVEGAELTLPSRCWDDLPEEVDDILFQALDPDMDERFETVADFADELAPYLGDVQQGKRDLSALIKGEPLDDDDYDDDYDDDRAGRDFETAQYKRPRTHRFRDRLAKGTHNAQKSLVTRAIGAVSSGLVSALGAANIPQIAGWDNPLFWAFVLVPAALGAISPAIGALVSFIILSASLMLAQAYALSVVLLMATVLWWWFVVRSQNVLADTALVTPLFAAFGLAPFPVLLSGFCASIPRTLATALYSSLLCVVLASMGSLDLMSWDVFARWSWQSQGVDVTSNALLILTNRGTWCLIVSWILGALVVSLCCRFHKHWLSIVGAAVGFAFIMTGIWAQAQFLMASTMIPSTSYLVGVVFSGALLIFICACFEPPLRPNQTYVSADAAQAPFDE